MADMVEHALEETIQVLRSAKKAKLLSTAEVSQVVRQRRDHEYKLRGRNASRETFIEYAAFEKELAALLTKRAKARNLKRTRMEQVVGPTAARANLVYSRAVKRFKGDVDLWLYYARHCVETGSKRAASKVFARAIAMRPDSPQVWLAAIGFHFDTCGDVSIARKISQRALRAVPESKVLWRAYFRMELAFLAKVIARRIAVRIPIPKSNIESALSSGDIESEENVPKLEEDDIGNESDRSGIPHDEQNPTKSLPIAAGTQSTSEDDRTGKHLESGSLEGEADHADEENPSLKFWDGAIPLAVFRQARNSIAMDVSEMLEYWKITVQNAYSPPMLVREIAEDIDANTAKVHAVSAIISRLEYDVAVKQLAHSIPPEVIGLDAPKGSASLTQDTSIYDASVAAVKKLAPKTCVALTKLISSVTPPSESQMLLLLGIAETFLGGAEKYLDQETVQTLNNEMEALRSRLMEPNLKSVVPSMALEKVAVIGTFDAWSAFLNASKNASPLEKGKIRRVLADKVAVPFRNHEQERVALLWVAWEDSYVKAAEAVHLLTLVPPLSKRLLLASVQALKAFLSEENGSQERKDILEMLRELYGRVLTLEGADMDIDLWVEYSDFERMLCGDAARSAAVVWKANKVLTAECKEMFMERLYLRGLAE